MKNITFLLLFITCSIASQAQLKTTVVCPAFSVDVLKGRVNETINPNSTIGQVQTTFPCFTSSETESAAAKCGNAVYFKDKDITFFVTRHYVEIGEKFKGKLSLPLMGAARNGVYKWLGNPKIKDVNWDAYQTEYGILILYFNKAGKVNKIQFSTLSTETINLCE